MVLWFRGSIISFSSFQTFMLKINWDLEGMLPNANPISQPQEKPKYNPNRRLDLELEFIVFLELGFRVRFSMYCL